AVLQHDPELAARALHGLDALQRPFGCHVERLLHEHMLAGSGRAQDEVATREGWREQEDDVDRRIGEDAVELGRERELRIGLGEGSTALLARREAGGDLGAPAELTQALNMR